MAGALAAVAALLGLLLVLLAVPVTVAFSVRRIDALRGRVTVGWFCGLVRRQVDWPASATPVPSDKRRRTHSDDATHARSTHGGNGHALRMLRDAAFRRRLVRLVRDAVAAANIRRMSVRARIGLGDPADTGRLWALLGPLGAVAQNVPRIEMQIDPEFMDPVFELDVDGECMLVPLRVLALAAGFVLSPVTIRAWRGRGFSDG